VKTIFRETHLIRCYDGVDYLTAAISTCLLLQVRKSNSTNL